MVLIKTPQHIYISPKDCWNDYIPSCLEWWSSCILVGVFPLPMEWDVIPGFRWIKPHVLHGSFAIRRKTFWHDVILALHAGKVPTAVLHSTTTIAFQSIGWHANFTLGSHTAYPQKNEETNVDSLTFWGDGERESTVDSLEQPLFVQLFQLRRVAPGWLLAIQSIPEAWWTPMESMPFPMRCPKIWARWGEAPIGYVWKWGIPSIIIIAI